MLSDYLKSGASATLLGNYVYVNGERLVKFKNGNQTDVAYFVNDHLGSVLATVGYNGNVKSLNLYRPWGEMLSSKVVGASADPFRYTGQFLDEDLSRDLMYYGQRYYDPALRIFTSVDPMWYKDPSTGSYVYCRNNPVKYVDKSGLEWYNVVGHRWVERTITAEQVTYARETAPMVGRVLDAAGDMPKVGDKYMSCESLWGVEWNDIEHQAMNNIPVVGFIHAIATEDLSISNVVGGTATAIGFGSSTAAKATVTLPRFRGQLVKTWCQSLELDRAV